MTDYQIFKTEVLSCLLTKYSQKDLDCWLPPLAEVAVVSELIERKLLTEDRISEAVDFTSNVIEGVRAACGEAS